MLEINNNALELQYVGQHHPNTKLAKYMGFASFVDIQAYHHRLHVSEITAPTYAIATKEQLQIETERQ